MNSLFLQQIRINWDQIEQESYLRGIDAIREVEQIPLTNDPLFTQG